MMDDPGYRWMNSDKGRQAEAARAATRQVGQLDELKSTTREVHEATVAVQEAVIQMATETTRTQKLALWVGVGTALLGAVVGGFAGAIAAQIIGG